MKTCSHKKGFTLVELIIVISIIAVLASLAFMALSGETAQARDSKRLSDLKTFEDAIATSNGKNKKIDYEGLSLSSPPPIITNTGSIVSLRGAYIVKVQSGLFDSDVIPTIPRDPKGAPYLGAFMSTTDYQLFATKENPDTKQEKALVRGSFKEGAILDVLHADADNACAIPATCVGEYLSVSNPGRFVAGDVIKVDSEHMVVTGIDTAAGAGKIYVYRVDTLVDTGVFSTNELKVHNKGAAIKLIDSAPGAESLACLGTVTNLQTTTVKTNAEDGGVKIAASAIIAGDGVSFGSKCVATSLITDEGDAKPYSVVTQ